MYQTYAHCFTEIISSRLEPLLPAIQPYSHTAIQPYSHTAIQPYSHTAIQPYSHTAIQPYSQAIMH
ncbi:hypothetical protein APMS7_10575 [Acinetobacter pittii]|nr:hypothetical protein APMS7_10575 [Acinetobacter pittii]